MPSRRYTFLTAVALAAAVFVLVSARAQDNPDWTRPFPPFKIIGNIFWVGSYDRTSRNPGTLYVTELASNHP